MFLTIGGEQWLNQSHTQNTMPALTFSYAGSVSPKKTSFLDPQNFDNDWAANCKAQQGLIAIQAAVKKALVKVFEAKSFRVKAGDSHQGDGAAGLHS